MATFTERFKEQFVDALRETCNVSAAARIVGMGLSTVYKHRKDDIIFAERWDEALQEGIELLEYKAQQRAFDGVLEPVFYQGMEVGSVRKYSDTLTMFLLKAHAPERHRDRSDVKQELSGGVQLSDTARAARLAALLAAARLRKDNPADDTADLV